MTIKNIGIYWDRAPRERDRYVGIVETIPCITRAHVMMGGASREDSDLDERWGPADLGRLAQDLADIEVATWGVAWARPNPASIGQIPEIVRNLIGMGAEGIEIEGEGNWQKRNVAGYSDLAAAERALWDAVDAADPDRKLERRVTCHLGRLNRGLHERADSSSWQAYSKHDEDESARHGWGGDVGPGWRQFAAYDRLRQVRGLSEVHRAVYRQHDREPVEDVPRILGEWIASTGGPTMSELRGSMALALWSQGFPGREAHEAMLIAYDSAVALGCTEIQYWSLKWVARNSYALEFLRALPLSRYDRAAIRIGQSGGRTLYEAWIKAMREHARECAPMPPWQTLSIDERTAWCAIATR